jgi:hypothetical protein
MNKQMTTTEYIKENRHKQSIDFMAAFLIIPREEVQAVIDKLDEVPEYTFPPFDSQQLGTMPLDVYDQMLKVAACYPKGVGEAVFAGMVKGYFISMQDESNPDPGKAITFIYENHKQQIKSRRVVPLRLYWGTTEHYPEPGWLLEGFDMDIREIRTFVFTQIVF